MRLEHRLDSRITIIFCLPCTETFVGWRISMICYIIIMEMNHMHLFYIKFVSIVTDVINFFSS